MKILKRKFHHFTKGELVAEEIIVILFVLVFFVASAYGASTVLNMRVKLIQCGPVERMEEMCRKVEACCNFLAEENRPRLEEGTVLPQSKPTASSAAPERTIYE